MRKIFFVLLFVMFSGSIFAQAPIVTHKGGPSEREIVIMKLKYTVEAAKIQDFFRKCIYQIDKGSKPDGKALTSLDYYSFSSQVKDWLKYRWFIADTGLSRKWLKSVYDLMIYMTKTKTYVKSAKLSGNTKTAKYKKSVEYFDVAYKRFVKLVKKPVRVSGKSVRKAKVKKVLWQKAMRKKYKIKEKIQEDF